MLEGFSSKPIAPMEFRSDCTDFAARGPWDVGGSSGITGVPHNITQFLHIYTYPHRYPAGARQTAPNRIRARQHNACA